MLPLAQPPRKEDGRFDDWMFRLWKRISSTAGLAWELIDTTGSNLTDIETRNHVDLQNHNTTNYYHLTQANHTDLTDGGTTTLHYHADIVSSISSPTTASAAPGVRYTYLVSGTTTLTMPTAVGNTSVYRIKNVGVATVTVATTSSQTIDGSLTASLIVQYVSIDLVSDGSNWSVV